MCKVCGDSLRPIQPNLKGQVGQAGKIACPRNESGLGLPAASVSTGDGSPVDLVSASPTAFLPSLEVPLDRPYHPIPSHDNCQASQPPN